MMWPQSFRTSQVLLVAFAFGLAAFASLPLLAQSPLSSSIKFSRTGMKLNGTPLNGTFDFKFKLLDAPTGGNLVGELITISGVSVSNGSLPAQSLDFGPDAFNGDARFVQVLARQGTNSFKSVGSRSQLFAVPYALALPGLFTIPNESAANVIGGYGGNTVSDEFVRQTISGGGGESVENTVTGAYGTIGGGRSNLASAFATVGGGVANGATGSKSTIAGGDTNTAGGTVSSIGGGVGNSASGDRSTIGGGNVNSASGIGATIPGGQSNVAAGAFSFAAGHRGRAFGNGTFVWADSINVDFTEGADNRFAVRATGGAEIFTSANLSTGVILAAGGGTWASVSDRTVKSNIQRVDAQEVLDRVVGLPISTWNYIAQDESIRHIGPMAQDFHAVFGFGESDRHITTIDADGVALAAIQGLHQLLMDRDRVIDAQQKQIEALSQRLHRLEAAFADLATR